MAKTMYLPRVLLSLSLPNEEEKWAKVLTDYLF